MGSKTQKLGLYLHRVHFPVIFKLTVDLLQWWQKKT